MTTSAPAAAEAAKSERGLGARFGLRGGIHSRHASPRTPHFRFHLRASGKNLAPGLTGFQALISTQSSSSPPASPSVQHDPVTRLPAGKKPYQFNHLYLTNAVSHEKTPSK